MTQKKVTIPFLNLRSGEYSDLSDADMATIRYNLALGRLEASIDGGPYQALGGSGDGNLYNEIIGAISVTPNLDGYLPYVDGYSTELGKITVQDLVALVGAGGGVSSVGLDGGTTGLTFSGTNPITTSGTLTLTGTLGAANGGTGLASPGALNNVLTSDGAGGWTSSALPAGVSGSGVATQLAYFTGTSAIGSETGLGAEALTWDATNNALGVRTASPTAGAAIDIASGQLAIPDGTGAAPAIAFRDDMNTGLFSPGNDIVGIAVNGTEIARMQQTGAGLTPALLIGTTAPIGAISGSGNISVDSSDPSAAAGVVMLAHGPLPAVVGTAIQESYRGGQFAGVRTLGTKTAPSQVLTDAGLWNAIGAGYTSAAGYNYGGLITVKAEEAYTAAASGGRIEFHTTLSGTSGFTTLGSATTERMRITNAGNIGIGTATPNEKLTVSGGITQSGGAVSLTGNASSSLTTSSGDLNLTSAAAVNVTSASNLQISANGFGTTWPTALGTSGQVLANNGAGALSWTAMPANGGLTPKLGNVLVVDAVNGNDGTGTVNGPPFATVEAAIAYINTNLLPGVTVWIMPGTYILSSPTAGITIPATCSLRGMSTQTTRLVMNAVNPGGMVTMITMGENSRVEDVSITLNSSNATTNLTGIALPGAASTTSKLRTMVLTVDNSGLAVGDTTNVYGIHDSGTGTVGPSSFSFNFTRGVTINVLSNGGGIKRGVLVDGPNDIIFRDTNFYVKEPSSIAATGSYVGIESNNNDASVQLRSCSVGAPPFIFTNTKLPVVVAETANIALSGVYVLQGVTLIAGMQVLAAGQTIGTDNGIWVVQAGAWTRATDMPAGGVALNATTKVYGGTYAYTTWVCTTTGVIGAVPLTFVQQGYTGSDILQTLPVTGLLNTGIQVGPGCDLINKNAGGKAFTTYVTPKTLDFGQFANISAAVRYMWPGTLNNLDATEIFYRFQQKSIVQGMFINLRTPPGVGKSLTVIVRRSSTGISDSGFNTLMTATISGTDRSAVQYAVSEVFQRNEYLSVQVSATGPGAADLIVELDLF